MQKFGGGEVIVNFASVDCFGDFFRSEIGLAGDSSAGDAPFFKGAQAFDEVT